MAETSWPSPSHNSRAVTDREYEELVAAYAGDGLVGVPTEQALVYGDGTGQYVKIRAERRALVRGHMWSSGASEFTKSITPNGAGSARRDLVVLRLTRATWNVTIEVKLGSPGASAPSVTQDLTNSGVFEIPLAIVNVQSGASSIASGDVQMVAWHLGEQTYYCLSTTRPPATPGRRIYEFDTGFEYVGVGSAYVRVGTDTAGSGELGPFQLPKWTVTSSPTTIFDQIVPCRPDHFHNFYVRMSVDTNWPNEGLQWYLTINSTRVDYGKHHIENGGAADVMIHHLGYKTSSAANSMRVRLQVNSEYTGTTTRSWTDQPNGGVLSIVDSGAGTGSV